ncbi:hypothetical protein Pla8534_51760 [Lignipirellula cremea]|uniref:Uncharacterized protein n=2 Tax=Lignipirellula cremea TaxID=2528010 RepID=A0A518DZQ8_9BACT|nr:hypothetical protein Pla8534_51760 [Lignipirellula cremea]
MLEREEWEIIARARSVNRRDPQAAFAVLERASARLGIDPPLPLPPESPAMAELWWPMIVGYHMFTGVLEDSPNSISHHLVSEHGPPCSACGKPLRTPRAKMCAACGVSVSP